MFFRNRSRNAVAQAALAASAPLAAHGSAQGSAPGWRPLIDLRNVVKSYRTDAGEYTALKGVSLSVGRGEFVAIVGKSGSGKSTFSNMITGIDRPTSGEVFVDEMAVHTLTEGEIAVWRGKTVGVVFQFFQLLPTLTVLENIMLPMDFCNTFRGERKDRALYLLEQVEMAHQANKLPTTLSGGQQQRVAIARALANDPALIVADEPTGNLDTRTADQVFRLFEELVSNGKTIVMVTHDDDLARRATRTVTITDGQILSDRLNLTPHQVVDDLPVAEEVFSDSVFSIQEERHNGHVLPASSKLNTEPLGTESLSTESLNTESLNTESLNTEYSKTEAAR